MLLTVRCNSKVDTKCTVAFPLQQWLCERVTMLRYTYLAYAFVDICGLIAQGVKKAKKILYRRCPADGRFTFKLTQINNDIPSTLPGPGFMLFSWSLQDLFV
jgi:hypothetical protein